MKRSTEILSGIATQVFLTSLLVWIFCFTKVNNDFTVMEIRYPVLCAASVLFYLVNFFLIRKGIRLSLYAFLQVVMTGAGVWLCVRSIRLEPFAVGTLIIICAIYAVMLLAGAFIAYERVQESGMLVRFDMSAFMIIILLFLEKWLDFPARTPALIMCLISLGVSLAAIIASRVGRFGLRPDHVQGSQSMGRTFLVISILVVAGLTALLYFLASDTMEHAASGIVRILTAAGGALKAAALYLYQLIQRFFQWLAGLFPQEEMTMEPDAMPVQGFETDSRMDADLTVPIWFYVVLGVLIAGLVGLIIFRLRKYRMKKSGRRGQTLSRNVTRESHLKASIQQLFAGLARRIRFRIDAFRLRNTIPGLLVWCERHVSAERARLPHESAEAFYRRLAASKTSEEYKKPLLSLADMTEAYFYSAGQDARGDTDRICGPAFSPDFIRTVRQALLSDPR